MTEYNANNRSAKTLEEAQAVIGSRATLPLTGKFVEAGESAAGVWVKFEVDPRWGFPRPTYYVMDLDPFEIEP